MDYLLGSITLFAGAYIPRGWALCNGQLLPIASNTALFAILQTVYGGDGSKNFGLPNMPAHAGANYIICTHGVFPSMP